MKFKFLISIFLILISFNFVSAKLVCGSVVTDEPITPAWYEVDIFYFNDPTLNTSCMVSPDGFRYCCSVEEIMDEWEPSMVFGAEILDEDSGYVALPVYMELSEDPYDIFPELELKKVIHVYEPKRSFNISKSNLTYFSFGFMEEYSRTSFGGEEIYLDNGMYSSFREIPFGFNSFEIQANGSKASFKEIINYTLLEEVNVSRDFECNKCKENKIKKGEVVDFSLKADLSSNVSNFSIYEYIPFDWEVISNDGEIYYGGGDYNIIHWFFNGDSFVGNYSVKVPDKEDKVYFLKTFLEDLQVNEDEYFLYKYVPPIIPPRRGGGGSSGGRSDGSGNQFVYNPKIFSKVNVSLPLVAENNSLRLALYSKNFSNDGSLDLNQFNFSRKIYNRSLKFIEGYNVNTNLGSNIGKISFELGLNKSYLDEKGYDSVKVYGRNSKGNFVSLTGKVVGGGNDLKFISDSEEFFKEILVFGVKSKLTLWDKIVQWYWNLFGFRTGVI